MSFSLQRQRLCSQQIFVFSVATTFQWLTQQYYIRLDSTCRKFARAWAPTLPFDCRLLTTSALADGLLIRFGIHFLLSHDVLHQCLKQALATEGNLELATWAQAVQYLSVL